MTSHLERFYELMERLARLPGQGQPLGTYSGRADWPERGVYYFREPGEERRSSRVPRIVRVGTHAVSAGSKSTLWGRLRAHRGNRDGRGNHRGSIFRLHVGAALLRRAGESVPLETWGVGSSASRDIRAIEVDHERLVSSHIGAMPVLWVAVMDAPGPKSVRALLERSAIALLSRHGRAQDQASEGWLGRFSPRAEISSSGLWNLDHLGAEHEADSLDVLDELIGDMERATVRSLS